MLTIWAVGGPNHPALAKIAQLSHLALIDPAYLSDIEKHLGMMDKSRIHSLDQRNLKEGLESVVRSIVENGRVE